MRLAHLRQPGQRANGQRRIEIVPDVLDDARQTSRRNAERLLTGQVRSMDKRVRHLAGPIGRKTTSAHHQEIHSIVLNTLTRRGQVMAQTCTDTGVLLSHRASSNRPGTDRHTAFDAPGVNSRRKFVRYALIVAWLTIPRRNVRSRVALRG